MYKIKKNGGEMDFLVMILMFLVVIFILWVLTGGPQNSQEGDKPFITPGNDQEAPLRTYNKN